jgi:hypothetical protein
MTTREMKRSKNRQLGVLIIEAVKDVVDAGQSVSYFTGRLGNTTHSLYARVNRLLLSHIQLKFSKGLHLFKYSMGVRYSSGS